MEKIRTFIAVDFSAELINQIGQIIHYFKTQVPEGALKWVESKNIHLTLKFLGDISTERVPLIENILKNELQHFSSFDIGVEGLGMYPNKKRPRVIWLGIVGGQSLIEMHQRLDRALLEVQVPQEGRAFSPHLTIARVRRRTDPDTAKSIGTILSQFKVDSLSILRINEVHFYQSDLTRHGPIYTRLISVPLNKV